MKKTLLLTFLAFFCLALFGQTYTINQGGNHATCSATLYDSGGNSGNYGNNQNKVITFCSNNSTCVNVTFTSFNLDSADFLYIYNGPNTASQLLAVLTGNALPTSYSSFFGCLTFQFVSNDTITASGFSANIACGACSFSGGGNGTLTPIYDNEVCGLNYTQVSQKVTTRYPTPVGTGLPSTLVVSGLPAANTCWSNEKALLYWTESSNSNGAVTVSVTNPLGTVFNYNVSPVGVGIDKCWSTTFTTNYRIDVTAAISGNGNYIVNISSGPWNVDGITLIMIYRDLSATYTGRLMINDGLIVSSAGDPSFVAINGINACATSTVANAFLMVGDMQDNVAPPSHTSTLNGTPISFPNTFWNYDQTATTITAGQATAQFGTAPDGGGDCYSVVGAGIYYQTNCQVCPSNAFSVPISQTIQTCSGGDIVANPGGGAPPYVFNWNTGDTSQTLSGVGPGTYTVTVVDNIGCQATNSITVNVALPITNSATINNVTCNGNNNGSITIATTGGSPSYNYSWNIGSTSNTISNLSPGTYVLTTTDSLNCVRVDSYTITSPNLMSTSFTANNITCNGINNGSIQSSTTGGTSPYSYLWNNGATTDLISGLSAGTYVLTVTDSNNCIISDSIAITTPLALTVVLTGTNLLCNNDGFGTAVATINGGIMPYSVLWNTGATTVTINSLNAGTYSIVVLDSNNCSISDSILLTEPQVLLDSIIVSNVLCFGDASGTINLFPYGGTTPYQFAWNNGANTQNLINVMAGIYFVTITDSNNCTKNDTTIVIEPSAINVSFNENPTCKDSCYGDIILNYTGGISPFQLIWSTGDINVASLDSLCEGSYSYILIDSNNCTVSDTISIGLLSQINAYFTFSPDSGFAPIQVSFTDASGGTIIGWMWDFGDNNTSTSQNPSNQYTNPGTYPVTLTIIDSLGCGDSYTLELTVLPESTIIVPNIFSPNGDGINDVFTIKSNFLKSIKGSIYNRWGELLYHWNNLNGFWDGRTLAGKEVPDGTYFYIVEMVTLKGEEKLVKGTLTLIR